MLNRWLNLSAVCTTFVCISLLSACSSTSDIRSDLHIKGAPDWVNEGTQAIKNKNNRYIHGVGSAPAMGDASLQKATAETRARAEVAKVVSSYLDVSFNDFNRSDNNAGDVEAVNNQNSIEQNIQSLSQAVLNGSTIKGAWLDRRTNILYAAAEYDLKAIEAAVERAETISPAFKEYFNQQGAELFDRL